MSIEERLKELGLVLPQVAKPLASYEPALLVDSYIYTSGQLPLEGGALVCKGRLGEGVSIEEGHRAARLCALNCLAAVKFVLGSLDLVERIVKVTGFVASSKDFTEQPRVVNGASDLLFEVFNEKGRHARSAVGVNQLPLGAPVEIEMVVKICQGACLK